MRSSVKSTRPELSKTPLLVVGVRERTRSVPKSVRALDRTLRGALARVLAVGDFEGKSGETATIYPTQGARRVVLVGLGPSAAVNRDSVRTAAAVGGQHAIAVGAPSMYVFMTPEATSHLPADQVAQSVVEGAGQGAWAFEDLRSEPESKGVLQRVTVLIDADQRRDAEEGRRRGESIAAGQTLARNLQMRPGNHCTPSDLAAQAKALATAYGFKVTVKGPAQMRKEGMGAILAVAQGAAEEPRLITLEYRGAPQGAPICLVGKGVTFDSGGISLKPGLHMEDMKFDMSGAAAVLGVFETLGRLRPSVNVVGVVPATENLPSGTAIKPGDVVTSHLGTTIEIINTDAEGRLILSDALSYARRFEPGCIIDAATLTGAIVIALGEHASGLMGNDQELTDELVRSGEEAGERCWPLPLWDAYKPQIKSTTADIKNVGGRAAGSITAGLFLKAFVEDSTPWAHLDIAGTAWIDSGRPGLAQGPTGVGVRLFAEFILGRATG